MKDKRIYLKVASILNFIYIGIKLIYYFTCVKSKDEIIANIFLSLISILITIVLYKYSKKDIEFLKDNKFKIIMIGIWVLFDCVIPGILCFLFIKGISNHKKSKIPIIKHDNTSYKIVIKESILVIFFLSLMFIFPRLGNLGKPFSLIIYPLMFIITLLFNYDYLKSDLKVFIKNIKLYLPFIIKRYFIMLLVMIIVSIPVVFLNKAEVSENQKLINAMFIKMPMLTFFLSTLYAPFVEENIFRLSLSKIIKNKYLFIIISGISFGVLHMIDKSSSFKDILYIIQYSALGICLAKAYSDSNNIYVSISIHFIQNLVAALGMLFLR